MEFKHRDNAVFCELVCLCEAGWLTSVFTLCPFVTQISEQTKKKKKNLFQINFSMKHLLTYQLLPQVRRLFFIFQQLCFAVVFLFDNTLFYHYALNTYSISGRQHAT